MLPEWMKTRRSIRKFQSREVEREKVDAILSAALLAPSSRSIRPWEFVVVTDRELLKKLSACREQGAGFLAGAPLGIVVMADAEVCDVWVEDASIAAVMIQLAAHAEGLGSCWIQVRERLHPGGGSADEYIRQVLGIPARYRVECMIAAGYPGEAKNPYDLQQLRVDKIHYNGF